MAGFYISTKFIEKENAEKAFSSLSFSPKVWKSEFRDEKHHCILSRLDRKDIWAPAQDDTNQIYVFLSGRIALNKSEWNEELDKAKNGGLACSYIINKYLEKELQVTDVLNGAYLILIIDKKKHKSFLITDRMGFYPVYVYENERDIALSTNADVLSKLNDQFDQLDLDSIAEVLKFGYCVHSNTYYKNIKQLDPGSVYELRQNKIIKLKQYWIPKPLFSEQKKKNDLIIDLATAINSAVKRRTNNELGKIGLFLSAGADSRSILAAAEDPATITNFTFYDVENNEYNLAKKIAQAYGSPHVGLKRESEHYGDSAKLSAKIISGNWNITDVHYAGFINELNKWNIDNYLSGCFADFLFKGIAYNRVSYKLLNKNLPFYKISPFDQQWYFHISKLNSSYDILATERNLSIYNNINLNSNTDLMQWEIEKTRLFPISREATFGSRQFLYRTLPWDPVLADNDLLKMFQKIPPKWKVNGEVWKKAVFQLGKKTKNIVDNNNLAPLNYNKLGITIKFLEGVIRRKITGRDIDGTPLNTVITRGSWPNLYYYLKNSKILNELWKNNTSSSIEIFNKILGYNPYNYTTIEWADKDINLFFRLLTLKLWLESNRG